MKKENIFYPLFALTILIIRTGVFFFPQRKLMIGGMAIHHFWIGIVLILLVFPLPKRYNILRAIIFPIGLGMAADEITFIILGGGTIENYWSALWLSIIFPIYSFPIQWKLLPILWLR